MRPERHRLGELHGLDQDEMVVEVEGRGVSSRRDQAEVIEPKESSRRNRAEGAGGKARESRADASRADGQGKRECLFTSARSCPSLLTGRIHLGRGEA